MIIYLEKEAKDYELASRIISNYDNPTIIEISNYKNIFDKNIPFKTHKCLIIAKLKGDGITEAPQDYAPVDKAFFFKTSLNCPFDCSYCYLKGAFKNDFQVIFVNYEDISLSIKNKVDELRNSGYKDKILFYASDYSDTLAIEPLTGFHKHFIPFFEKLENVEMETRTKSSNIKPLLELGYVPQNIEIAFSLNPKSVIADHEKGSSSLDLRIESINALIDKGFKVGLRFLPLLPIEDFKSIYSDFLDYILQSVDLKKINSISAGGLLYTKDGYQKMLKKDSDSGFLYRLEADDSGFVRASLKFRKEIYALFREKLGDFNICLDNHEK